MQHREREPLTAVREAEMREHVGAEHRETILLLTQALNNRVATLARHPAPPGWWFTPPLHYRES